MVMAGLWSTWRNPANGEEVPELHGADLRAERRHGTLIHNRMPVILDESDWPKWLAKQPAAEAELLALLKPSPGRRVENLEGRQQGWQRQNTGPELILPLEVPLL